MRNLELRTELKLAKPKKLLWAEGEKMLNVKRLKAIYRVYVLD